MSNTINPHTTTIKMNNEITSQQAESVGHENQVPQPTNCCLTDAQLKKIAIVAITTLLVIGPIIAATIFSGGAAMPFVAAIIMGVHGSIAGIALSYLIVNEFKLWPKINLQTAEGAETARRDLKTMNLSELHEKYSFDDLARYGFINQENAQEMEDLHSGLQKEPNRYTIVPHYYSNNPRGFLDGYFVNNYPNDECYYQACERVSEANDRIAKRFRHIREQEGFLKQISL